MQELDFRSFAINLVKWYDVNKRDLPWRSTKDPFLIWLSEIILQQTRIEQGIGYYHKFVRAFPNICALASAKEQTILKMWEGLGYYNRARNLHHTSKVICQKYNGHFPDTYKQLITLRGIGDYTASAIASFAFGEAQPVIDGNVIRFMSRFFGIHEDFSKAKSKHLVKDKLRQIIKFVDPAIFNNAMMEFGSLQCKSSNPKCEICVFSNSCQAYQTDSVELLPLKKGKKPKTKRYFHYFISASSESQWMRERKQKDIWQGLYEFPLCESRSIRKPKVEELPHYINHNSLEKWKEIKHNLTHQELFISFWKSEVSKDEEILRQGFEKINFTKRKSLSLPRALHCVFE